MTDPAPPRPRLGDRSLFPSLAARSYLAHSAISPASQPVVAAVDAMMAGYASQGLGAITAAIADRAVTKARLARMIGAASAEDLAFVANTTTGVVDIALTFPWRPGDRVVLFEGEFPANVTPWQRAAELFDLELVWLPLTPFAAPGGADLGRLEETLRAGGVRLVALSHVQFQTGLRAPIRAISDLCHDHGARLFVDAIQSVGLAAVDVASDGIDFLAAGSHKWLMGLEGCAVLYVSPDVRPQLRPHVAGWMSHADAFRFLFEGAGHLRYDRPLLASAGRFELGAPHAAALAALGASTALLEQLTADDPGVLLRWVGAFLDWLEAELVRRGFTSHRAPDAARRSGILSVSMPPGARLTAPELVGALGERGVVCTAPDGLLRFAPHWPNALTEVPLIAEAVDDAL